MQKLVLVLLLSLCGLARPQEAAPLEPDPAALEAGQLSKLPVQKTFIEAEYPAKAQEQGLQAEVILLLDIGADGKVEAVGVLEPSAYPDLGFEEAAMAAAQQFEFEPAELDGQPLAVQISYSYRFVLKPKAPLVPEDTSADVPAPAAPQIVNLQGLLLERGTRNPLGGVLITVFREQDGGPVGFEAVSDKTGSFQFYDLPPGEWRILVEVPGYYPFRTTEEIVAGERVDASYFVEKASYNPFDVRVTAPRPKKEVSRTVLEVEEIEKVPGTMGDPLRVIQNLAGVARGGGGMEGGGIIIRGSAPEDSKIFIDGIEVPTVYHFGGLRSVLPIGVLEGIDFYPGNFSSRYGRATGGIVDVRTKRLEPQKVGGSVDVSLLDTAVFVEAPLGEKASIALGGRRSYIDFLIEAVVPDDAGVSLTVAPRYYDWQILGRYRPSPAHDFQTMIFGSDDRFEVLFEDPAALDMSLTSNDLGFSTTFYRATAGYRYIPNAGFENNFQLAVGRDHMKMNLAQFLMDFDIGSFQLRDTTRTRLDPTLDLVLGLDLLTYTGDIDVRMPHPPKEGQSTLEQGGGDVDLDQMISRQIEDYLEVNPALFAELEYQPLEGLLLIPGLRLDYFDRLDTVVPLPHLTARYALGPVLTPKAGVGLYAQDAGVDESDEGFGNPDLDYERALHWSAGLEYRPRPYLTFDVTGFYKNLWSLVSPTDRFVTEDGQPRPLVYDNRGEGRVYGLELVTRHDLSSGLSGWIAYTLSRAERHDSDRAGFRLFDYDQTHILTAVASYALPRNWQVGTRFRLVSGNPTTPVTGALWNGDTDRYSPIFGDVNSDRDPIFHQLDLRLDKRWVYDRFLLALYLDVQNVYSHQSGGQREYNFDYSRSKDGGGLPLLTILGLQAEF
ncbi:MAG: hypothetical protein A2284_03555 [Deltaproteobacteria bacterium RIFOXYA12_FULL_61_11]|nr:MAG: hypothetical protein A2284_03555 [Deltaproteobacteria bacterium RIFOXYA12_FULL_61_11]